MTEDHPPFVPPVAPPPMPVAPPVPAPPVIGGPPPVAVPPVVTAPPSPAARAGWSTRRLGLVVTAASLVFLVLIGLTAWGAQALGHSIASRTPTGSSPVDSGVSGPPGLPIAVEPLDCPTNCFGGYDTMAQAVVPTKADVRKLGVPTQTDALGDFDSSDAGSEYDTTLDSWNSSKSAPDGCFFTYYDAPVQSTLDARPEKDATTIDYAGDWEDDSSDDTLAESLRLFASSDDATAHMQALSQLIIGCTSYTTGTGSDLYRSDVRPAAALDGLPASVAAIGWVESSDGFFYYVTDLQRGNLVVRSIFTSTYGAIDETTYRDFVLAEAGHLAALETPGIATA